MLQTYPAQAQDQLEFNKIRQLLSLKCRTDAARKRVDNLKFHSRFDYIAMALQQTQEYKLTLESHDHFPNDFTRNVERELKYLSLSGAILKGEELLAFRSLALNVKEMLQWLKNHDPLYPQLRALAEKIVYEKEISQIISAVIDDSGQVKDNASRELMSIRMELDKARQLLRKTFEGILRRLSKQGYLAEISESFLSGRRTVAVFAEHKRIVKGILHGESDTAKTVFIEPEETIELNNEVSALERAEHKEIQRILAQTTAHLSGYQPQLDSYYHLCGLYDFIRAKALLAAELNATLPRLSPHPSVQLIKAVHPLLFLHNQKNGKPVVPLNITLDRDQRILMISGPNAGGKTVSMKTVGLLQMMLQAGLLVPVDEQSEMGVFKQIFVHIGDTQSIENELSTYSAHLRDMKYFLDFANGKTLFFIDELGSGSDPNLGGAFAEAIVEELAGKRALGIITTHYLNLKVMAGKVQGIYNGAMTFDEERLEPLYQLAIGKPGSSYTFAIAQRSELSKKVIDRARQLTERGHFKLDKMLLQTEQQSVRLGDKEKYLDQLLDKNEALKEQYEELIDKERLRQHFETLKLQNKIKKEELEYLRDTERKFKQIIHDWKKAENKQEVLESAEKILFRRKQIQQNEAAAKKADKKFRLSGRVPQEGDLVRHTLNHQVGRLTEIKGKKAVVRIGQMPFTINLAEWVTVEEKRETRKKK
ncbi:endonuclease MutS2 [Taibaiella helva]|uniref:endonuclease MutS2 n=1 Tax=Taibaiella helva TaxID=2301235 RepID=UPI000E594385|nr:DNA mismatch repair protein MutS [Taibaiella helva]